MHYVYFLELSNSDICVGFSGNLKQGIKAHNDRRVPATARFLPAKAKIVETKEILFENECIETCLLDLNETYYEIKIIIEGDATLYLDNIKYGIEKTDIENVTIN